MPTLQRSLRFCIQALYSVVTRVVITRPIVLLHLLRELCGLTISFNFSYTACATHLCRDSVRIGLDRRVDLVEV